MQLSAGHLHRLAMLKVYPDDFIPFCVEKADLVIGSLSFGKLHKFKGDMIEREECVSIGEARCFRQMSDIHQIGQEHEIGLVVG